MNEDNVNFGSDDENPSEETLNENPVNENPVVDGQDGQDDIQELTDVQEPTNLGDAINEVQAGDGDGDAEAEQELASELAADDAAYANDGNDPEVQTNRDDENDDELEASYKHSYSAPADMVDAKVVELRDNGIRHSRLARNKVLHD